MAKPKEEVVPPLNIDKALGREPKNRIARMGVELEGGWLTLPEGCKEPEADTSVFKDPITRLQKIPTGFKVGELALGPMQPAFMRRAVTKYYPHKVDHTCGLHVHMGFETLYQYSLLADSPAYQETVIEYLSRWGKEEGLGERHPLWARLKGDSVYCQKKFWPQAQMEQTRKDHDKERYGHRYTMIHYCWGRYQTVECRLLPMMDTSVQAVRVVKRLLDITNAYLLTVDKGKVKLGGKVELDNGDIYEEYIEARL